MAVLVIWIVLSLVIGYVWKERGHDPAAGFFVSLLLSPVIGLIVGIVMSPKKEVLERRSLAAGEGRKCPFCAEVVKREAVVCRFCGKDLPAVTRALPRPSP